MSSDKVVRVWNVLGTSYPVVRSELSAALEGEYDPSHGEVRIAADIPAHRFWEVESHELGHVVAHAVGVGRSLCEAFGLSVDVANKIEEEWVARFVPVYLDTLQRNGYLTPPDTPAIPAGEGES